MCWTICDWTGRKILTASAFRISVDYSLKYLALLGNLRFVFNVQIYRTKWIIWLAYSSNFYVIPIKNNVVFRIVNIFPLHVLHRALLWKIQFCKSCIPFKEKEQSCSSIFLHSVNGLLKQLEQTRYSRYKPKKPIRNEAWFTYITFDKLAHESVRKRARRSRSFTLIYNTAGASICSPASQKNFILPEINGDRGAG